MVFTCWIDRILLPNIPEKGAIVMNKAAFHKDVKNSTYTIEKIKGEVQHQNRLYTHKPKNVWQIKFLS